MAWEDGPQDEKYITFNRQDFLEWLSPLTAGNWLEDVQALSLKDAVVIRRQDLFASPCLDVYARTIAIVALRETDPKVKAELLDIADYFQRQAELAAEEGFKLPDL